LNRTPTINGGVRSAPPTVRASTMSSFGQYSSQDLYGPSARLLVKKNKQNALHPPIGASPGELRLWMKQNGLLNEPAKRLSSVGRRVSGARLPPLRPTNMNVPVVITDPAKGATRQLKAEAAMEVKAAEEQAEAAKREARRAARREAKERAQTEAREQAEAARALAVQAETEAAARLDAQRDQRKKEAASWRSRREEQQQQPQPEQAGAGPKAKAERKAKAEAAAQAKAEAEAEARLEMEAEALAEAEIAGRANLQLEEVAVASPDVMQEEAAAETEEVLADEAAALARIAAAEADEVILVPEDEPVEEASMDAVPPTVASARPLSPVAAISIEVPAPNEEDAAEEVKVVPAPVPDAAEGKESVPMEEGSNVYVGDDDDFEADFEEEDLELP
jgi:hypothetical protein